MVIQSSSGKNTILLKIALLLGIAILLVACETNETPTQCPDVDCPEISIPEPVLYEDLWATSAHADDTSEAFTHWDEEDPPEIPVECAKCHSRPGFIDFLGADGSKIGEVENPVEVGTTITCYACHNEVSLDLSSADFPSGVTIRGLGPEARCVQCHQGLASTITVNNAIAELGLTNEDTPSEELAFINSHSISGATPFGTEVQGAYEYEGQTYSGRFIPGDEFFGCDECHNQHTLELKFETCGDCHTIDGTEPENIRVNTTDFDGDSDIQEGIALEIEHLHESLLTAIQRYAIHEVGIPIAYEPDIYPYFFIDANEDGVVGEEETDLENRYLAWTPRFLRAAYNYNYVSHDPGAYAHNSTYILQILYDSLADIGGDTSGLVRP